MARPPSRSPPAATRITRAAHAAGGGRLPTERSAAPPPCWTAAGYQSGNPSKRMNGAFQYIGLITLLVITIRFALTMR